LQAAGFGVGPVSSLHYLYNRRTGAHAWRSSQVQTLHVYGPAFRLGDVDDSVVDSPPPKDGWWLPKPSLVDIEHDMLERLKASPVEWPPEVAEAVSA
jgi:hypothetical protein